MKLIVTKKRIAEATTGSSGKYTAYNYYSEDGTAWKVTGPLNAKNIGECETKKEFVDRVYWDINKKVLTTKPEKERR